MILADGTEIEVDTFILALGYKRPALAFLPEPVRAEFDTTPTACSSIATSSTPACRTWRLRGSIYNPLHLVSAEIAALWVDAVERGDLALPPVEEMEASRLKVRDWKRANVLQEPASAYWVSSHLHNYLDVLLMELGLKHKRKGQSVQRVDKPLQHRGLCGDHHRI